MTAVCIDASIAVKWFLSEDDSDRARALFADITRRGLRPVAPAHFRSEVANVLYRRVLTQSAGLRISDDVAFGATALLTELTIEIIDTPDLYLDAYQIARAHELRTVYDALYVAVARTCACDLWTADDKLVEAVSDRLTFVHALRNWAPST